MPPPITPSEAAARLGVSERALRTVAREIGACSIIGRAMILTERDIAAILEATRPCSKSTSAATSGTSQAPLPGGDFAALQALRTKQSRSASQPKPKRGNGKVISMDRGRACCAPARPAARSIAVKEGNMIKHLSLRWGRVLRAERCGNAQGRVARN